MREASPPAFGETQRGTSMRLDSAPPRALLSTAGQVRRARPIAKRACTTRSTTEPPTPTPFPLLHALFEVGLDLVPG